MYFPVFYVLNVLTIFSATFFHVWLDQRPCDGQCGRRSRADRVHSVARRRAVSPLAACSARRAQSLSPAAARRSASAALRRDPPPPAERTGCRRTTPASYWQTCTTHHTQLVVKLIGHEAASPRPRKLQPENVSFKNWQHQTTRAWHSLLCVLKRVTCDSDEFAVTVTESVSVKIVCSSLPSCTNIV